MDAGSLILQCVACATVLAAAWKTGDKHVLGPVLSLLAEVSFIALNVYLGLWVLVAFGVAKSSIHFRNFMKWRTEG